MNDGLRVLFYALAFAVLVLLVVYLIQAIA